jgi:hypothetical protein
MSQFTGNLITRDPRRNKGTAFTLAERRNMD